MATKAQEKIIEAITMLMEGYAELQEELEEGMDVDEDEEDDDEEEENEKLDSSTVSEMRAAIDAVVEAEDYSPEEIAAAVTTMTDALEEINPDIFVVGEDEEDDEDEDDDLDEDFLDDDDDDLDDLDEDEDDDEDEEEEEELEDDE